MKKDITYVGLDAHKSSISVAMQESGGTSLVEWKTANDSASLRKLVKRLEKATEGEIRCCYEAGPLGYALKRTLEAASPRVKCTVIAPSLIPVKPGERIKTDRRDAKKLCELHRAGLLTEVHPPSSEDEALRDLVRARDDAREDLMRARHRLNKLLLRRGVRYTQGRAWTRRHQEWLKSIEWEHEADRFVFDDYRQAIELGEQRVKALDAKLSEFAKKEPYATPVGYLRCFRGIDTLTAMIIVAELHDFRRFHSPRELMSYLGLVPSERSSDTMKRRGGITKAGNKLVRRVMIEAAWHYLHRPGGGGRALHQRQEGQPAEILTIAHKAQRRLYGRFRILIDQRKKPPSVAVVAIARELTGFLWAAIFPFAQQEAAA